MVGSMHQDWDLRCLKMNNQESKDADQVEWSITIMEIQSTNSGITNVHMNLCRIGNGTLIWNQFNFALITGELKLVSGLPSTSVSVIGDFIT
jgi:hypothetical protein